MSHLLGFPIIHKNLDISEIQNLDLAKVAVDKAQKAFDIIRKPLIVDDTGIAIHAWNGFPGPFIAHILKAGGMPLVLKMMEATTDRQATFETVIAYHDGVEIRVFRGSTHGHIARAITQDGQQGFGMDGIFIPDGENRTYAQMSISEKGAVSHRAKAVAQLKDYLIKKQ